MLYAASVSALTIATILNLNALQRENLTPVVAPKPNADARAICVFTVQLYRGSMPEVGTAGSSQLAAPSMRIPEGERIDYFVGGTLPNANANWYSQGDYFGIHGSLKDDWTSARFIGIAPVGKPFRFSGGDVWAEVILEEVGH